jgi:glucose-1-phosphate thymidylyltransferase
MREGDAKCAHIILRDGKWDIPSFLRGGQSVGLPLSYLMMEEPHGVPFTLDQAYSFVREALVIMGFPDILFQPGDAYKRLLGRQLETHADIVLGLFPARTPGKMDMVKVEENGQISSIFIKPEETSLQYTWIIAAWKPSFTEYLHRYTQRFLRKRQVPDGWSGREIHMGHVIQQAAGDRLAVNSVVFSEGRYVDIGTVNELIETTQNSTNQWFS